MMEGQGESLFAMMRSLTQKLFTIRKLISAGTLGLYLALIVNTAATQEIGRPIISDAELQSARQLFDASRFVETLQVLQSYGYSDEQKNEYLFLLGLASVELSLRIRDEESRRNLLSVAVNSFSEILVDEPNYHRARLELARAFFLQGKDRLAREQFERVLAGNPPAAVEANIKEFLAAIHDRRRWRWSMSGQLLWESNFNNAPTDPTVNLFGLPFRSDNAEPESTLGVVVSIRGTHRQPLSEHIDLLTGVGLSRTEFPGSDSDGTVLDFSVGPEFGVGERTLVGIEGQVLLSFNDKFPYYRYGGRIRLTRIVDNRTRLSFNVGAGQRRYQDVGDKINDARDWNAGVGVQYRISPTITFDGGITYGRSRVPADKRQNSRAVSLNGGITALLQNGYSLGLSAGTTRRNYTGQPGIPTDDGNSREDQLLYLQANVLRRDFTIAGFSPRLGVIHSRLDTNAQASSYRNNRLQLTMVRQF